MHLEHANRWLTGTHVRFWTCWWFSHTIFTRSRHTSRCDGAFCREVHLEDWSRWAVFDTAQILAYLVHNMSTPKFCVGFCHFAWLLNYFMLTFSAVVTKSSNEIALFLLHDVLLQLVSLSQRLGFAKNLDFRFMVSEFRVSFSNDMSPWRDFCCMVILSWNQNHC